MAQKMSSNPTVIETLKPSNSELLPIIESALKSNFKNATVEVAQCPDLSIEPFSMTSNGFGRKLVIAEVGGPGNLFPIIHKEKEYDLKEICNDCQSPSSFVFGPGAGPWKVVGRNCEMVADANFATSKIATKIASLPPGHSPPYKMVTIDSPKFSLMANLAVSEPGTSELLHCKCSIRIGKDNFPETIRTALSKHYGKRCVSLAGIFLIREGEAKLHVMPDFPGCPFGSVQEIDKWLHYFTMKASLVCASVFHSYDPGHKFRMEHTHCYSSHGDAVRRLAKWIQFDLERLNCAYNENVIAPTKGHYHCDTTPDTVVYEGWFTAAEKIFRIDEI